MPYRYLQFRLVVPVVLVSVVTGCDSNSVESTRTESTAVENADDHAHAHAETGPNGGHLIELDGGEYHAEWLHDDESGKVTVVLLDDKAAREVAIAAEYVTIEVAVGDRRSSYELKTVDSSVDTETSDVSRFELVSPNLLVGLKMGQGVDATLTVEIGEKTHVGQIEHHAHDENGHHHH